MRYPGLISIWFFIGAVLLLYGVIILGAGLFDLAAPGAGHQVALAGLHARIWWGALLLGVGAIYFVHFAPWRHH